MFISLMFAGHHTSSGTSAWTLIELIRHPEVYAEVLAELEELYADGQEVSFHALRQIPKLDNVVKETLRLHPPLIILMRVAKGEFEVEGFPIHDGDFVAASPAISNRIPEDFPDPNAFKPDRYNKPEQADIVNRWTWIPFGAGRHRCVGAAFAQMQIKAIFSVLLREYEFEMAQPADSYHNDHSKMVVQLARPAKARYRRRKGVDDGLPGRSRLGSVPRPCDVRAGSARLLPGAQAGQSRDPRRRAARRGPRRSRAGGRNVSNPSPIDPRERRLTMASTRAKNSRHGSTAGFRPTRTARRRATGDRWQTSTLPRRPTAGTSVLRKT